MPDAMNELDAIFADLGLDGGHGSGNGNKANTGVKKDTKLDGKDGNKKQKPLIETHYEGYTVRPIAPLPGEKKTWAKVGKDPMPFDSDKLREMALEYRRKTGKGPASQWRALNANQQGLVTRILEEKQLREKDPDAIWELFHARPKQTQISSGMFRDKYAIVQIELIVFRKDRRERKYVDNPAGTTTMPQRVQGEIIDLSVPLTIKLDTKSDKKEKKDKKNDLPQLSPDEILNMFGPAETNKKNTNHEQQIPPNPNPDRYFWNGVGWEEREQQPLPYPHEQHHWDHQHWQHDPRYAQQQYQYPQVPPPAPMPAQHQNPFQPYGTHPEQYADMPPNMDARAQYNQPQQLRSRSRSRSRSHHRRRSRRRSHVYSPSMSSSEAEHYSDITTPPSTPPGEEWIQSAGHFHRRKGQRYYREGRARYPSERVEIRPATTYRIGYVEELPPTTRPRPILVHDDYPRPRRRITDYAENHDDAEFRRPRQRDREEVHFLPRRYDNY